LLTAEIIYAIILPVRRFRTCTSAMLSGRLCRYE